MWESMGLCWNPMGICGDSVEVIKKSIQYLYVIIIGVHFYEYSIFLIGFLVGFCGGMG